MPEMDGWELARRLRQPLHERPAIVMLSALTLDKNHELGHERLHDDYLMKPVDFRQLLEKIHTLLNIEWVYEEASPTRRTRRSLTPSASACLAISSTSSFVWDGSVTSAASSTN